MLKRAIPVIIGGLILIAFLLKTGVATVLHVLLAVDCRYLALSVMAFTCTLLLKGYRWHLFLKPVGIHDLRLSMYSYYFGQMINEILPTGSGEIARISVIKQKHNISFLSLIPSVLLERFYDVVILLIISIAFASMYLNLFIVAVMAAAIIFTIFIFIKPSFLKNISSHIKSWSTGPALLIKFLNLMSLKINELVVSIDFYNRSRSIILINLILTVLSWVIFELFSQYFLLLGFGVSVPLIGLLGVIAISWILGAASMLPGGIGVMEIAYALVLSGLGVPFETGVSAAILYRVTICTLIGLMGLTSYYSNLRMDLHRNSHSEFERSLPKRKN